MNNFALKLLSFLLLIFVVPLFATESSLPYTIVDAGQEQDFDEYSKNDAPNVGEEFYGQDAQYKGNKPRYQDNGNGTVTDLNSGLIWQQTPDFIKRDQTSAEAYAASFSLAAYDDWRLPTIKELFSIVDFNGNQHTRTPYLDTTYFDFEYPVAFSNQPGERGMDAQYASSTHYVGTTMHGDTSAFGFNFADGRIKSYPTRAGKYLRCVRGNAYGENDFVDQGNSTVIDKATGLQWMKSDSGIGMTWSEALRYAESLEFAGFSDWRLPNVKELQSIVDYDKAPDATNPAFRSAAIDPIFEVTNQESWFWSSTTHLETSFGYYVCFGQATSARLVNGKKMNAHGAGAVRSDPKSGDPSNWPDGLGPQHDEIRIYNYVRCVRGTSDLSAEQDVSKQRIRRIGGRKGHDD